MDWSPLQEKALKMVKEWKSNKDQQIFELHGFAGTGKSTLAIEIANVFGGNVGFAAFTGKAVSNLVKKGCEARTVHSWIYIPAPKSKQKLKKLLKIREEALIAEPETDLTDLNKAIEEEEQNTSRPMFKMNYESDLRFLNLLIIDESSMIGSQMAEDLAYFGVKILAMGDPAQLPPVRDTAPWMHNPDIVLTEIHRQARGNPIIELAWDIKNGKKLQHQIGQYVTVKRYGDIDPKDMLDVEQVICGKNDRRLYLNNRIRLKRGLLTPWPTKGEKLLCMANDHDNGVLNGELYNCKGSRIVSPEEIILELDHVTVNAHAGYLRGEHVPHYMLRDFNQFQYGYCITAHKAQGSQWRTVTVLDESWISRGSEKNWLYTAVTRAEEEVTILTHVPNLAKTGGAK